MMYRVNGKNPVVQDLARVGVPHNNRKGCIIPTGLTQANPETLFFRQCLLLKTTIYSRNQAPRFEAQKWLFIRNKN